MDSEGAQGANWLFTIGYEGKSIQSFVAVLMDRHVEVVVDVRELPVSRKPGFSKSRLQDMLAAKGIEYVPLPELGSPRPLRTRLREANNYEDFFSAYRQHLGQQAKSVTTLVTLVAEQRVCLMCYEADPMKCHRREIAAELRRQNGTHLEVRHL